MTMMIFFLSICLFFIVKFLVLVDLFLKESIDFSLRFFFVDFEASFVQRKKKMLETIYSFLNGFIRNECYPTFYDRIDSNLWIDLTLFRLLAIFFAAFISLMIILPGFRSNKVGFGSNSILFLSDL